MGIFVQKGEVRAHRRLNNERTVKSQTSQKATESKFQPGARHPQLPVYQPQVLNLAPPENTRRRNHRTILQLHASVGVWILALVQFLGGILGLRSTSHPLPPSASQKKN